MRKVSKEKGTQPKHTRYSKPTEQKGKHGAAGSTRLQDPKLSTKPTKEISTSITKPLNHKDGIRHSSQGTLKAQRPLRAQE